MRRSSIPICILFYSRIANAGANRELRPLGFSKGGQFGFEWVDQTCRCTQENCEGNFGGSCEPRGYVIHNLTTDKSEQVLSESELKSQVIFFGQYRALQFPPFAKADSLQALVSCQKDPKDSNQFDRWSM